MPEITDGAFRLQKIKDMEVYEKLTHGELQGSDLRSLAGFGETMKRWHVMTLGTYGKACLERLDGPFVAAVPFGFVNVVGLFDEQSCLQKTADASTALIAWWLAECESDRVDDDSFEK